MAKTAQRQAETKANARAPRNLKKPLGSPPTATKSERITTLLQRAKGASIDEIITVTGWQPHSVRGFLSGTIVKRKGLTIASNKADGHRRYRIVEAKAAS